MLAMSFPDIGTWKDDSKRKKWIIVSDFMPIFVKRRVFKTLYTPWNSSSILTQNWYKNRKNTNPYSNRINPNSNIRIMLV